jgi:hypothetical protein
MEDVDKIMEECKQLLKNCHALDKEMKAMNDGVEFLLNEYKTNKRYFRLEPGRVTIEDVIKTCFEFGWASKNQFDYESLE